MPRQNKITWADPPENLTLESPFPQPERIFPGLDDINPETFPDFLDDIGLVGMGGSGFKTSTKIRASMHCHTLVINGVECEPGITIDQSVLLHDSLWVAAGANACAKAIGAIKVILVVKDDESFVSELKKRYGEFSIEKVPQEYPAGAEKIILKKLTGQLPAPGVRPYQLGYLIQNVVSLRAVGRALIDGIPVVERPLTLAMPSTGFYKNIIAPVGLSIRELFDLYNLQFDPAVHFIADSGLMMGHVVEPEDPVEKTTLSLLILSRDSAWQEERPCIRCGECNNVCPLDLHPFSLVEMIKKKKTGSDAFRAQMTECFLCGLCSKVCPSGIPLVHVLKEGKQCL